MANVFTLVDSTCNVRHILLPQPDIRASEVRPIYDGGFALRKRFLFSLLASAILSGLLLAPRSNTRAQAGAVVKPKPIDFNRQIRPILSDNCFSCHGPDEESRMANLRLDLKDAASGPYVPRDGYRIITPGDSAASRPATSTHAPGCMPPGACISPSAPPPATCREARPSPASS